MYGPAILFSCTRHTDTKNAQIWGCLFQRELFEKNVPSGKSYFDKLEKLMGRSLVSFIQIQYTLTSSKLVSVLKSKTRQFFILWPWIGLDSENSSSRFIISVERWRLRSNISVFREKWQRKVETINNDL